jgi:hypothetical protein
MPPKTALYNLMNHPCYLALTKFIDVSGFKISRYSVREALKKIEGVFDLPKLHELLSSFFSDLLVIQIDTEIDNHDYIIAPCFLLRTEGSQFFMYVVLKIDKEKVLLFEHNKKDFTVSIDEFHNLLRGSILIFKEEETYSPTETILQEYAKEQQEDKEYVKSIQVVDNFISAKDCDKIINFCEESNLFTRSKTGSNSSLEVSDSRTSSTAFIETNVTTPIILDLKEKIAAFLDCNLNKFETLQAVRYYKFEGYKPHFDAYIVKRKLTCLLYLTEDFSGGETYFPEVDFSVTPKVGRLLVFENLNEHNNVIPQSFHQGSPILDGVKYACNIWIRS